MRRATAAAEHSVSGRALPTAQQSLGGAKTDFCYSPRNELIYSRI